MLVQKVAAFIARTGMFAPSARVGVAVSGGADSVCLLRLLSALRSNWNLQLTVLHLNHCLRAEESDADEQFVRDLAASCGLPFRCERADVAREAARTNDNLEQAARRARRRFFRALMTTGTLDCVGLGHTKNDQAETDGERPEYTLAVDRPRHKQCAASLVLSVGFCREDVGQQLWQ